MIASSFPSDSGAAHDCSAANTHAHTDMCYAYILQVRHMLTLPFSIKVDISELPRERESERETLQATAGGFSQRTEQRKVVSCCAENFLRG